MLNKLREIFNYYKKIYNLKTVLYLERNKECIFNTRLNHISYDINWLKDRIIWGFDNTRPTEEKLIFSLLHEIGHAIDWEYNRELCKKEKDEINWALYSSNSNYQTGLSIEKRANKFAKKELIKWINI